MFIREIQRIREEMIGDDDQENDDLRSRDRKGDRRLEDKKKISKFKFFKNKSREKKIERRR